MSDYRVTTHDYIIAGAIRIQTCVIDSASNSLRLTCGQLERKTYVEVNKVLEALGGKWKGGKVGAHLFPFDPTDLLEAFLATGKLPDKNPYDFYPTPAAVVSRLLSHIDHPGTVSNDISEGIALDPSAGDGAIVGPLWALGITTHAIEIQPHLVVKIEKRLVAMGVSPVNRLQNDDFLSVDVAPLYDLVVMNPPFTAKGDASAYMTHIYHAWECLVPSGQLISVTPPFGYQTTKKHTAFRAFVETHGTYYPLPPESFASSGTSVQTMVIVLRKP